MRNDQHNEPDCNTGNASPPFEGGKDPGELAVSREGKFSRREFSSLLKTITVSAAVAAVMIAGYDRWYAQKIVALDVKGYIARQRDLFVSGRINEEQLKQNFDRLEGVKEKVPGNRVIIMGDVLVRKNVEVIEP